MNGPTREQREAIILAAYQAEWPQYRQLEDGGRGDDPRRDGVLYPFAEKVADVAWAAAWTAIPDALTEAVTRAIRARMDDLADSILSRGDGGALNEMLNAYSDAASDEVFRLIREQVAS